jgi:hypothetical protein
MATQVWTFRKRRQTESIRTYAFRQEIGIFVHGKPDSVWTIIRESEKRLTIHLINLTNNNEKWNEPKNNPQVIKEIAVRILQDREVEGIWFASPDDGDIRAKQLNFETQKTSMGRIHTTKLPSLGIWSTIWMEMK